MFTQDYWLQRKYLKVLHGFTYKMIKERRRLLEQNKESLQSYTEDSDDVLGKTIMRHLSISSRYNYTKLIRFFQCHRKEKKIGILRYVVVIYN